MSEPRPRTVGRWGIALVAVPFLLFVLAEISALIWVSTQLGWWTLAILAGTTLLGAFLLQREWRRAWGNLSESLRTGALPPGRAADAVLVLIGGVLLILPGFISDVVGLLLLLPFTRPLVRAGLGKWAGRSMRLATTTTTPPGSQVIKGEVIEDDEVPSEQPEIERPDEER